MFWSFLWLHPVLTWRLRSDPCLCLQSDTVESMENRATELAFLGSDTFRGCRECGNVQTWQPSDPTDGCSHMFQMFPDKEQKELKNIPIYPAVSAWSWGCHLVDTSVTLPWEDSSSFRRYRQRCSQTQEKKNANGFSLGSHGCAAFASPLVPSRRQRSAPESG